MKNAQVARLLAYVTGMVNQQLLLQNEYLLAENRILRAHLPSRLLLTDPQRREQQNLVPVKYEMLRRVQSEGHSITRAATAFGFSRRSFYQALSAFEQDGLAGLLRSGNMCESRPRSHSILPNIRAPESDGHRLSACNSNQMHSATRRICMYAGRSSKQKATGTSTLRQVGSTMTAGHRREESRGH